ncbi:hypothetical protein [Wenzhouxiangella sp. EGI_FJ10409]|uniref:hypothetical protein n=1 Tax=Wenzhouxiangella sp. EGI_FJ10409 TaxID=3243767 RepID=UPI0035DEDD50
MTRHSYSTEQLKRLVGKWLNEELREQVTAHRLARRSGEPLPDGTLQDPEQLSVLSSVVGDSIDTIRSGSPKAAKAAYDQWEDVAVDIAKSVGIDFESLSTAERERLTLFGIEAESKRYHLLSQHSPEFRNDFWNAPEEDHQPAPKASRQNALTLQQAWERCVEHYRAAGRKSWQIGEEDGVSGTRPSKNQHAKWLREDLFELWGQDLPISEITWEHLEELRDCFRRRYPAGRKRKAKYRGMSLRQIVDGPEVPEDERIRGSGKESKFRLARDFFRFLRTNPSAKSHFEHHAEEVLKVAADPVSTYEPWSLAEVSTILESEEVHSRFLLDNKNYHPAGMFWLLAVLVYTGARQQEIMGLRPEDVELDCEHPVIHIRQHEHRPQVKTEVSVRWVPIHTDLLKMGLADWVRFRAQSKQPTLWPVTERGSSYWADRFREDITKPLGLYQAHKKVMHSFRGTFDSMASNVMPTPPRRLMTGHVGEGTDFRHYIRQMDNFIPEYSEHINKMDLKLDLDKLEQLWRRSLG